MWGNFVDRKVEEAGQPPNRKGKDKEKKLADKQERKFKELMGPGLRERAELMMREKQRE